METSQSNSIYTINDSIVRDDDINDIIKMKEEIEKSLRPAEQKGLRQRKLTSKVLSLFPKVLRINIQRTSQQRSVKMRH